MTQRDSHPVCVCCLGQEHAKAALSDPFFWFDSSKLLHEIIQFRAELFSSLSSHHRTAKEPTGGLEENEDEDGIKTQLLPLHAFRE